MPVILGQVEMDDLAKKLAKMRFNRAKAHVRSLDKKGKLDIFRVVVGANQWHTKYTLPTMGLQIILVERREETGSPNHLGFRRTRFRYVEARVEPIPDKVRERLIEKADDAAAV
ncbi:MAG: hypothetical protein IT322_11250 [Anaerolineae bacterium]|nr:hypothetical protein [Anaerolineae bacterium]